MISRRGLAFAFAFGLGYAVLFEGLPDDWALAGLPLRGEAVLLAASIAVGPRAMAGVVLGALALRLSGIDSLPASYAVVETLTLTTGLFAAHALWRRVGIGWNALAATASLTAVLVAGLGTYWTLALSRSAYDALFLQAFLAINVIGAGLLLAVSARTPRVAPVRGVAA